MGKNKKYNIGDKFIIEITSIMNSGKETLYGTKFNSLVFDKYGLEQLERYKKDEPKTAAYKQNNALVLIDNYKAQVLVSTLKSNGYEVETQRFIQGSRQYVLVEWK